MGIGTGIAIFFVIWWTTLFVTLPFKARSQAEAGAVEEGTEPAAPVDASLPRRLVWNTVLAIVVFGLYWFVTEGLGVGVDSSPELVPERMPVTS